MYRRASRATPPRGRRRRWPQRARGASVSSATSHYRARASSGSAVLQRVDLRFGNEELPQKVVIVNVERSIRLQRAEHGVECGLPCLIGSERRLKSELRFRHELLDVEI